MSTPSVAMPHKSGGASSTWRRLRGKLPWAAVIAVALASTALGLRYRATHATNPLRFETATIDRGPIEARVTATGAVSALVTVLVGSQVSGRIDKLFVDFGSQTRAGQTIATIEASSFRASVAQARANQAAAQAAVEKAQAQELQARRAWTRSSAMFAEGLTSRAELEASEAELAVAVANVRAANASVEQSRAALDQAALNLRYATIVSPIDGVVISRNVDVGQTVAAALQAPTLFTIAQDLTRMQVDTNVAESDIGKILPGMKVTFTVDAYPQRSFEGTVRQVRDNAQTIQNVVTYDAVVDVENGERLLKPGMTASVTFIHATRDAALRLPNAALRFKADPPTLEAMTKGHPIESRTSAPDQRVVWVLRDGEPTSTTVRVGLSDGSHTEVLSGDVREGDVVVVEASSTTAGKK